MRPFHHLQVVHNCLSPGISRAIKVGERCRCTYRSVGFVRQIPHIESGIKDTILDHCSCLYTIELFWLNMKRLKKGTSLCTKQKDIMNNPTIFSSPLPKLGTLAPTALLGRCDPITQFYTRG